jgi:hypothetical protein
MAHLIGSATTEEKLIESIKKNMYWSIVIFKWDDKNKKAEVYSGNGKNEGLYVELKKSRYRLMMV